MTIGSRTTTLPTVFTYTPKSPYYGGGNITVNDSISRTWSGGDRDANDRLAVDFRLASRSNDQGGVALGPPARKDYRTSSDFEDAYKAFEVQVERRKRVRAREKLIRRLDEKAHDYTVSWSRTKQPAMAYRDPSSSPTFYRLDNSLRWGVYNVSASLGHMPYDVKDEYALLARVQAKLYGSGFHPGIFLAESHKAMNMISSSATSLYHGYLAVRRGDLRGAFRAFGRPRNPKRVARLRRVFLKKDEASGTFAKRWLEFQYGWRPLLKDLDDGAAYFADLLTNPKTSSVRIVASKQVKLSEDLKSDTLWFGFTHRQTVHRMRYILTDVQVASRTVPTMASFAAVAWEVTPYSFVADWALPISSYLNALRTCQSITANVVKCIRSETTYSRYMPSKLPGYTPVGVVKLTPYDPIACYGSFKRTVSRTITVPSPVPDLSPGSVFKVWQRAVNAVALLEVFRQKRARAR